MELAKEQKDETADLVNAWARHNVQFYLSPPQEIVGLAEIGDLMSFRRNVLQAVETAGLRHQKHSNEYQHALDFALRHLDFKSAITSMSNLLDSKNEKPAEKDKDWIHFRRKDNLSHFISRLAYCATPDLRQWFIQQEVDLFRFRVGVESPNSVKCLLRLYGIPTDIVPVDSDEHKEIELELSQIRNHGRTAPPDSDEPEEKMDILKVYFTEATDLIRNRKVILRRGQAFVPYHELTSVIVGRFRSNLSRSLATMSKYNDVIQEDPRLAVLKLAGNNTDSSNASIEPHAVNADTIDMLSAESFPPCMKMVYKHLHTKHHLRHQGRMQFGLFLKGIGVTLEESLKFWKREFASVVDDEKFEKEYAYNIRHNYGKEGKRADYTSYNCLKIINASPAGPSDCHGCPFKIMDSTILQQHLDNWGIVNDQQKTIIELAKSRQFDRACSRYFEFSHGLPESSLSQLISHPTQFFEESRKHRLEKAKPSATDTRLFDIM